MSRLCLDKIILSCLNEAVDDETVKDAIDNKYYVSIHYNDEQDPPNVNNALGRRIIQPMAVGRTKKGNPVVRAFQLNGNSRRGAPKWKFFRMDRITSWTPMKGKQFTLPPDESYGRYNTQGDKSMSLFIDNAKFDDTASPLDMARAQRQNAVNKPKISTKNVSGPIGANQQWKKNVFTSQPNSSKYKMFAKNINDTSRDFNRFDDDIWAKAEAERDSQQQRQNGPILDYDVDEVDFDNNEFKENTNTRR